MNATTTCQTDASTTVTTCQTVYGFSTSTNPSVSNGFTYGEVVTSVFLFLIFMTGLYSFFYFKIKGFKVR